MPVVQQGQINTTALIVSDLYVQIVPPQVSQLNGLPTNILGVVGTAQWGPVNAPQIIGSMADYAQAFGDLQARKFDMGTQVAVAALQGANNFRCVRVTDGTDLAASIAVQTNCITLTGKYTGTKGNSIQCTIGAGSKASTYSLTVAMPGQAAERFDNIAGAGNALWVAMAAAVNNGIGLQGPSKLIVASAGAGATAPANATVTLTGGADGAGVAASALVGADTGSRTGMYALRGTFASIALLADVDDSTTWTTQVAFGLSEGIYMIATGPAGESITSAATAKSTAGIDSYAMKVLLGDWIHWADPVSSTTRLVSPQGFVAGLLANLSPEHSSLNKQLYGIVATQRTAQGRIYSAAEIGALVQAGIDVVTNPVPGGSYFGARVGHNSSSDASRNGDNYTRMTNYIAFTINAGMGKFIGQLHTIEKRREAKATLDAFLANMESQKMIGAVNGGLAFQVKVDASNNPTPRVTLGYLQADVKVIYLSIIEKFLVNVEGGVTVQIAQP